MSQRLEALRGLVAQDPTNSFMRYGLAMELVNGGQLEDALREFQALLAANETYSAAYYHGAQTLGKLGRVEEARAFYRRGIEVTTRIGDEHTRSELQAAMDLLG